MVTKTISSRSHVLGIQKATYTSDIYNTIYALIRKNVPDTQTPARSKFIYSSEPDEAIEGNGSYPLIVIESPDSSWDKLTLKKKIVPVNFSILVHSTTSQIADSLFQKCINAIEIERPTLFMTKLKKVNLEGSDSDMVMRGNTKIHVRTANFIAEYCFTGSL